MGRHLHSQSSSQQGSNFTSVPNYQYAHALKTLPSTTYHLLVLFLHPAQKIQVPGFCSLCWELGSQELLLHTVLGYWPPGCTQLILSNSQQLQNTPLQWHWEAVSIHDSEVMPVSPMTHCPVTLLKSISWFCFHITIMKFTVKYLSYAMKKLRLLDIQFHIQPNFSKHLKYSSPKLFKWVSDLSFRLILSTNQCLGIIYKFSSKSEICTYYCKELLYCLIFSVAYLPSDALSKSWACGERKAFFLPAIHLIAVLPHMKRCTAH